MRPWLVALISAFGTSAGAAWFFTHPSPVLVGVTPQATLVPWWYQACALPSFFLLGGGLWLDRRFLGARLALLAGASLIAVVRLANLIPLSGHATFLAGALVFAVWERRLPLRPAVLATTAAALGVTAFYKWQWHDEVFFLLSLLSGAALGGLSLRLARRPGPQ